MRRQRAAWDGGPGHYEVYYLSAHRPGQRHRRCGSATRCVAPLDGRRPSARCGSWPWTRDGDALRRARRRFPIDGARRPSPTRSGSRSATPTSPTAAWPARFEDVALGAVAGSRAAGGRARPPAAARARDRQDDPRAAAPRPRGRGHGALRRARARARRRPRRPGAPVGLQARRALGVGALQRPRAALDGAPRPRRLHRRRLASSSPRFGRELGPSTPVVGRFGGEDFRVDRARSRVHAQPQPLRPDDAGASRRATASAGSSCEVDAPRELARRRHLPRPRRATWPTATTARWPRCALHVWDRAARGRFGWTLRDDAASPTAARTSSTPSARPSPACELLRRRDASAPRGEHLGDRPARRARRSSPRAAAASRTGPYASLNLGAADRRRPRARGGQPRARARRRPAPARLAQGRQVHGDRACAVDADGPAEEADGQVDDARRASRALVLVADCLPVALAGARRPSAMLHARLARAGRRRARGRRRRAARPRARARSPRRSGPASAPCCYEVGDEVRARVRAARRERARSTSRPSPRARLRGRRRRRGPRLRPVHDLRRRERFFSHRRDGGVTGRQAGLAWRS